MKGEAQVQVLSEPSITIKEMPHSHTKDQPVAQPPRAFINSLIRESFLETDGPRIRRLT